MNRLCLPPFRGGVSRREFLKAGAMTVAASIFPGQAQAFARLLPTYEKRLSFYNTHTGEKLDTIYRVGEEYLPQALAEVNRILRDHRTNKIRPIDRQLLDMLHALSVRLETNQPFHVISGYRSPETNGELRKKSRGVARRSMHMTGKAIDIRLPGFELNAVKEAALRLKAGGVGYYPRSEFIHLDIGPVRTW